MPQLTQAEKAEKYDNLAEKKKDAKVLDHVYAVRGTEIVVNGLASVGLGVLKASKPAWEEAAYGLPIDGTAVVVGFATAAGFGGLGARKKTDQFMVELGIGIAQAGIGSLGQKGGRALHSRFLA